MLKRLRPKSKTGSVGRFLEAAHAGNRDRVSDFIRKGIDVNSTNEIGVTGLHLASKEGHVDVVSELVKHGARVDAATRKGITALHVASLSGKVDVMRVLLENAAKINIQSKDGFTPLYMAAQENHVEAVRCLLSSGASQSLTTEDGFTALSVALQQGHDDVASVLLGHGTSSKLKLPQIHIATKKGDLRAVALLLKRKEDNINTTSKSGFTPLHIAAHYGNTDIGRLLIGKGADVNFRARNGISPLHVASKRGRSSLVSLLVDSGADVNNQTRDGISPLHCAVINGGSKVVGCLLQKGASFDAKTRNGFSALHLAAQGDHVNCAKQLLNHGAPINDVSTEQLTPLHVAAHCGNVRSVRLLLEKKCEINPIAMNGFTPLHIAAKRNHKEIVELLIKHGAKVDAKTQTGLTPLHVASFMGHSSVVSSLLRLGSNSDCTTTNGDTALHFATRNQHLEVIDQLLHNGSQVDTLAADQVTPLHIAVQNGDFESAALLLHHGATPSAKTSDLNTPLHFTAAGSGKDDVTQLLLEHGASPTSANKKGFLPLHVAAKHGNVRVARLLLARSGVDPNVACNNDLTPLHVAVHCNQINTALLLLEKGAKPNCQAKNGYTALHIAAAENRMNLVPYLLEHGANINAESQTGFTPLHLSSKAGHLTMTTLLLERGASVDHASKDGLTPMHLVALGNRVPVAEVLLQFGANINAETNSGLRPVHLASQLEHAAMVEFLLGRDAEISRVSPNGQVSISSSAEQLSDDSAVDLQGVSSDVLARPFLSTEQSNEGQWRVLSEDDELSANSLPDATFRPRTSSSVFNIPDDVVDLFEFDLVPDPGCFEGRQAMSSPCSVIRREFVYTREDRGDADAPADRHQHNHQPATSSAESLQKPSQESTTLESTADPSSSTLSDNLPSCQQQSCLPPDGGRRPSSAALASSFLFSFLVDARGGAMQGSRCVGIRVIVPPDTVCMPTRITCRYVRKEKLLQCPALSDGEGLATRVLEMGPEGIVFSGPVIIEVSHSASLQDGKREVIVVRSDNGQKWFEHTASAVDDATIESLCGVSDESVQRVKIITHTFPRYFALISRFRHETATIGPEGGTLTSKALPDVRAIFPPESIKKSTRVQLQVNPVDGLVAKVLGSEVHRTSPVVTIDPRHRRFHQPIALTIPLPRSMNDSTEIKRSSLRVFSSRTEGIMPAVWEDITDAIAMTILNGSATLLVTVSARFWLIDTSGKEVSLSEVAELYQETLAVPFWSKFLVFAKRLDENEARVRLFSVTDDQLDKTLDNQEGFTEVARSNDVVVFDGKPIQVDVTGNLLPQFDKPSQTLSINFHAFRENRLPFSVKIRSPEEDPVGQVSLSYKPKSVPDGSSQQTVVCVLGVGVPNLTSAGVEEQEKAISANVLKSDAQISKAELHLTDIADILDVDWLPLAVQLGLTEDEVSEIQVDYDYLPEQALIMLHQWVVKNREKATGNSLERALKQIGRADVIAACMHNISEVTDDRERMAAKNYIKDSDSRDELTSPRYLLSSRDSTARRRRASSDVSYGDISSLPESRSFCYDTGSEIDSETEKEEYRKTRFDDQADDHCFYVDGSINSSAYANIRSTESEDSDAVLSDGGASDLEMGGAYDQKEAWSHPQWKNVVLRRHKDEARVMADATVRLSQVSDATMTPEDVEESDRELTPCVQDMASSNDTRGQNSLSVSNEETHNHGNVLKQPEAIRQKRVTRDKAENYTGENHTESQTHGAESESSEVVLQVKEGELFLSTDVSDREELLGDGTRVKRRTITRKQMRPVEEILVRGDEVLETRTKEEVVRIEVEEDITELEPGIEDEFGSHLDCETTSEEFEEMLADGVVIQKKVTRVRVRRSASITSSISDWENESSVGKNLDSVHDSKTSADMEDKILTKHEERKSLNESSIPVSSHSMVSPPIQSQVTTEEVNSPQKAGTVHRLVGEVFLDTEEGSEEGISDNGIKTCRKIRTTRHILPITEINTVNNGGSALSKSFEIIGTEIEEEILETPLDMDFDLENGESETSVEESEETMPDGTWIRKKTTWITVTPSNLQLSSDFGVNEFNPELNQEPLLNDDVMRKSGVQTCDLLTGDIHRETRSFLYANGKVEESLPKKIDNIAPSGDEVLNKKTDNGPDANDLINANDRNSASDSDAVMTKVDQTPAMEISFNATDHNTLLDSEELIKETNQKLALDTNLIMAADGKVDFVNEINKIELVQPKLLESEELVRDADHRMKIEAGTTAETVEKSVLDSERSSKEIDQKTAFDPVQPIKISYQWPADAEGLIKDMDQTPDGARNQIQETDQRPTEGESQIKETEQKPVDVQSQIKETEQKPVDVQSQIKETEQKPADAEVLMNGVDKKTHLNAEESVEESNDTKESIEEIDRKPSLDTAVIIKNIDHKTLLDSEKSKVEQQLLIEGAVIESGHQPPFSTEVSTTEEEQTADSVKHPHTDSIVKFKATEKIHGPEIPQGLELSQTRPENIELYRKSGVPVSIDVPQQAGTEAVVGVESEHLLEAAAEPTLLSEMVSSPTETSWCNSKLNTQDDVEQGQDRGGQISADFDDNWQQGEAEFFNQADSYPENERAVFSSETFQNRAIGTQKETPSYISEKMIESKLVEMLNLGRFKHFGYGPNTPHAEQTASASGDIQSVDEAQLSSSLWAPTEFASSGSYVKAEEAELNAEEDDVSKALLKEDANESFSDILSVESVPVRSDVQPFPTALPNEESGFHRDLLESSADFNMKPSETVLGEAGGEQVLSLETAERNISNSLDTAPEHEYYEVQGDSSQGLLETSVDFEFKQTTPLQEGITNETTPMQEGITNDSVFEENAMFEHRSQAETQLVRDDISKRLESALENDLAQESVGGIGTTEQGLGNESFRRLHLDSRPSEVAMRHDFQFEPSEKSVRHDFQLEPSEVSARHDLQFEPSEAVRHDFQFEPSEAVRHDFQFEPSEASVRHDIQFEPSEESVRHDFQFEPSEAVSHDFQVEPSEAVRHDFQFEPSEFLRGDGCDTETSESAAENGFGEDILAKYGFRSKPRELDTRFGLDEKPLRPDSFNEEPVRGSEPYGLYTEPSELTGTEVGFLNDESQTAIVSDSDNEPVVTRQLSSESSDILAKYGFRSKPSELSAGYGISREPEDSASQFGGPSHISYRDEQRDQSYRMSELQQDDSETKAGTSEEPQTPTSTTPRSKRINFSRPERRLRKASQEGSAEGLPMSPSVALEGEHFSRPPSSTVRGDLRSTFSPEKQDQFPSVTTDQSNVRFPVASTAEGDGYSPSSQFGNEFKSPLLRRGRDFLSPLKIDKEIPPFTSQSIITPDSPPMQDIVSPVSSENQGISAPTSTVRQDIFSSVSSARDALPPIPPMHNSRLHSEASSTGRGDFHSTMPTSADALMKEDFPWSTSGVRRDVRSVTSPGRQAIRSRTSPMRQEIHSPTAHAWQDVHSPFSSLRRDTVSPASRVPASPVAEDSFSSRRYRSSTSPTSNAWQDVHSPFSSLRRDTVSPTRRVPASPMAEDSTSSRRYRSPTSPSAHAWQDVHSPFSSLRRDTVSPTRRVPTSPMAEDSASVGSSRRYRSPTPPSGREFSFRNRMRRPSREGLSDVPLSLPRTSSSEFSLHTPSSPVHHDLCSSPPVRHDIYSPLQTTKFPDGELDSPTPLADRDGPPKLTRQPSLLQSTLEAHARYLDAITKIEEIVPGILPNPALMGPDVTQETIKGKIRCSTSDHEDPKVETEDRTIMKKSTVIQYYQPVVSNFYRNGILIDTRDTEVMLGKYVDDFVYDSPTDLNNLADLNGENTTNVDVSEETLADGTWLKHKTTRVVVGPSEEKAESTSDKNVTSGKSSMQDFLKSHTSLTASDLLPLIGNHPVLIPEIMSRLGIRSADSDSRKIPFSVDALRSQNTLSGKELVASLLAERRKRENAAAESQKPGVLSLDFESGKEFSGKREELIQGNLVTTEVSLEADQAHTEKFTKPDKTEIGNTSAAVLGNITTEAVNGSVSTVESVHRTVENASAVFLPPLSIISKVDADFVRDEGKEPVCPGIVPTRFDPIPVQTDTALIETETTPVEIDIIPVATGTVPAETRMIPVETVIMSAEAKPEQSGVNSEPMETACGSELSPSTAPNTLQERGGDPDRKVVKTTVTKSVKRKARKVRHDGNVIEVPALPGSSDPSPTSEPDISGSLFVSAIPASDFSLSASRSCLPSTELTTALDEMEETLTDDKSRMVTETYQKQIVNRTPKDRTVDDALTKNTKEPEFHSNMPELGLEQSEEKLEKSEILDVSVAKTLTHEEPPSNSVSMVAKSPPSNESNPEDGSSGTEV